MKIAPLTDVKMSCKEYGTFQRWASVLYFGGEVQVNLDTKNESYKQLKETAIKHNCAESELVKSVSRLTQIR